MLAFLRELNIVGQCRTYRIGVWSCPPFLFVVMGAVNVAAMVGSYAIANRFLDEPEIAALVVIGVSLVIFTIGTFIVHGFNQIAEANRMKAEFISIVSHQLRSPLSIFKWTLETLLQSLNANPARAQTGAENEQSYLGILSENAEKMIQLVNMLLEVSRIESGRMVLRRDPVQLDLLTAEAVRSFVAYAKAAKVNLRYQKTAAVPPVAADPERVKMVIQNLIDNAVRYSPNGGRVEVRVTPDVSGAFVEWDVQDQGAGIPAAEQKFIFQKFFRADHAMKSQTQGSGLGLYIASSVVKALGGEIGFQSEYGRGSTFWFRLPVYKS